MAELRYFPAGNIDAVTLLLWAAGETTLRAATKALAPVGVEPYDPGDRFLGGVDIDQVLVIGGPRLDVRAHVACADWSCRTPIVGARFDTAPFLLGVDNRHLVLWHGAVSQSVTEAAQAFRIADMDIGRNERCPCGSGQKFKRCHGDPSIDRGREFRSTRPI